MKSRLRRLAVTVVLTVLGVSLVGGVVPGNGATEAAGAPGDPLRVVGEIPFPKGLATSEFGAGSVVAVDAPSRRLFYLYLGGDSVASMVTYDISTKIPKPIALAPIGPVSNYTLATSYTTAYDRKRKQLAMVSPIVNVEGNDAPTNTAALIVYSETKRKVVHRWNLSQVLPGFYALGLTYSPADDLYYAVGEFSGNRYIADGTVVLGGKFVGPGAGVVAISPTDGSVKWVRSVPECQQVLYSKNIGSLVSRSRVHQALYFMCVSGGTASSQTYPGQSGLVRLPIDPKGTTANAFQLPAEFFAISGSYYGGGQASGIAAFDETTDRFYVQSISYKTPGAFVFDGRLTSWVGFVSSPSNADYFIGVNEGLGHLYIGTHRGAIPVEPTDGMLVADVRQTPVPAGEFQQLITSSLIPTDSRTNRLFVRPIDGGKPYLVVEDTTPVTHGTEAPDYDAQTSGSADTPANDIFYAIGATGYGVQAVQVGGVGSPLTFLGPGTPNIPGVAGGTRATMSARVGSIDLRAGGAAASAQAALGDINTVRELEGQGQPWPYPTGSCLDARNKPVKDTWRDDSGRTAATYTIECDLAGQRVHSRVRMGASGSGGATAQKSSYDVTATRDRTKGAYVETSAAADGVTLEVAGAYLLSLGKVSATSTSVAHGRAGTATSVWTRAIEGVRITDALGKTVLALPGCTSRIEVKSGKRTASDTCATLADALNKVAPTRLRVFFPMPDVAATPKGAFAGVEQSEAQYLQQNVVNDQGVIYRGDSVGIRPAPAMLTETYNDTTERSRTVTALAATQANAVFEANPPFVYPPVPTDGPTTGPTGGPGGNSGDPGITPGTNGEAGGENTTGNPPPQAAGGTDTNAIPTAGIRGFLFLRRGLEDVALLVLLSGLVLGGAGTMWRRRRLVEVLVTVPRKEAAL
ncbi:MAG TPA: hypothetical protein VNQ77_13900 [Frankiaceae bacterium]|nr:hypothetical protein [Frankiaceae bacterium]